MLGQGILLTIPNLRMTYLENINYLRWIISDIKQKSMEYLLIICYHYESIGQNKKTLENGNGKWWI